MSCEGGGQDLPLAAPVSRETTERLSLFNDLLLKWSGRINLVARGTLTESWSRHIADSAQLVDLAPAEAKSWTDLGSGAGFPGLVVAILRPDMNVTLIESDQRKATFLRTVLRETGANAAVLTDRIEAARPQNTDIVSARALAPLKSLLEYADRHLKPSGTALFPKGRQFQTEIDTALESWHFHCETYPSRTEQGAALLRLTEIVRV